MNVVLINGTYPEGSTGRIVDMLASELRSQGNRCSVCYASGSKIDQRNYQIGNSLDHKLHALLSRISGMQGYFSVIATLKFVSYLKKIQPDVVHIHNLHSNYINLKILCNYLAENDIPTIITLHDCWFYTGKCTYYTPQHCEKWKYECGKCPRLHLDNVNPTFLFDRTKKCIKDKRKWINQIPRLAVVGVSKWIGQEASNSLFKEKEQHVIYNGIDLEIFHSHSSNLRHQFRCDDKFVILMVSSYISKAKWYDEMIALSNWVSDKYQIIAVGKNKENLIIPENVIHIPQISSQILMAQYFSMADVCVNTTKYETFGMVTAEAICCDTQVIVYDNTASPELVAPGTGYVVDEKNGINGIIEAIEKIVNNKNIVTLNKTNLFSKKKYDVNQFLEKYILLYDSIAKNDVSYIDILH